MGYTKLKVIVQTLCFDILRCSFEWAESVASSKSHPVALPARLVIHPADLVALSRSLAALSRLLAVHFPLIAIQK
jgi:hypothetical protein